MQHCQKVSCWELLEDANRLKQASKTSLNDWHNFLEEIPENLPRNCNKNLRKFVTEAIKEIPVENFDLEETM